MTAVLRSGSPRKDAGPDTENSAPIFTGGAAKTAPAIKRVKNNKKTILKIFFDIHTSNKIFSFVIPSLKQIKRHVKLKIITRAQAQPFFMSWQRQFFIKQPEFLS